MNRRHAQLMVEYIEYRRDYLITLWTELRDEHPRFHSDIDDMFAAYCNILDEQIKAWEDVGVCLD